MLTIIVFVVLSNYTYKTGGFYMNLHLSTKEITLVGLCTALMAVFSQITIPLPFTPVPMTLQICGIVLI